MAGLKVGQALGCSGCLGLGSAVPVPQVPGYPTFICDEGINYIYDTGDDNNSIMMIMITILDTGLDETQQAKDLLPLIHSASSHRQQGDSTGVTGISLACLKQGGIWMKIAVTYSASEKQ